MARIIVMTEKTAQEDVHVLLEESVDAIHLSTDHAAQQLIERLRWAVADALDVERAPATA